MGVKEVLRAAAKMVEKARSKVAKVVESEGGLPVISLNPTQTALSWKVLKQDGHFTVTGTKIEKFAARTNFDTEPGIRRLKDIMRKMGIMHELLRLGIQPGDAVVIGKHGGHRFTYEP
jgi:GTP-binding protein